MKLVDLPVEDAPRPRPATIALGAAPAFALPGKYEFCVVPEISFSFIPFCRVKYPICFCLSCRYSFFTMTYPLLGGSGDLCTSKASALSSECMSWISHCIIKYSLNRASSPPLSTFFYLPFFSIMPCHSFILIHQEMNNSVILKSIL